MPMPIRTVDDFKQAFARYGSIRAITRATGQTFHQVRKLYLQYQSALDATTELFASTKPPETPKIPVEKVSGSLGRRMPRVIPLHKEGTKRYILTSAQNNTEVFQPFWDNLQVLAEHYDAEIWVSRFTYIKHGLGSLGDKAQFVKKADLYSAPAPSGDDWRRHYLTWAPELRAHFVDEMVEIAPNLVWCGEMNILPTATSPLSGLSTYTGQASAIYPHVKIAMESVPTLPSEPDKFLYTTGSVTVRNYIQRKAGLKAEFHHCHGACLVEVDADGTWWVRQINADSEGRICDLDLVVSNKVLTKGNSVEAMVWGDVHVEQADEDVTDCNWSGEHSIARVLRPKTQFVHDFLDFYRRNHHERGNYHAGLRRFAAKKESVRDEVDNALRFLGLISDFADKTVVVASNHDEALTKWLREADYKNDLVNAKFFLECQLAVTDALLRQDEDFFLIEHLMEKTHAHFEKIDFLRPDESYIICRSASGGGIECGMHGHLGPNGARGGAKNLARSGRKANIGHTHTAGIFDGLYSAGTSSKLDLGYNKGPSSWSHSHIVTYLNAKRAILTIKNGRWRGGQLSS